MSTFSWPAGEAWAAFSSRAGHDQERVAVGGHRQAGEPLQLLGVVAGHVAQVGPRGEQQDVDARLADGLLHPGEALGRVQGGCRWSRVS